MVSHEDHAISEVTLQTSILPLGHLTHHTGIAAHSDHCWCPPLGKTCDKNGEALLRVCHVALVELRINELQRRAQELRRADSVQLLTHVISQVCEVVFHTPELQTRTLTPA
jgi:hypothetical protein